jgi:L-fucose mutarotase/ribose pyranase (RbsD/FucU family)
MAPVAGDDADPRAQSPRLIVRVVPGNVPGSGGPQRLNGGVYLQARSAFAIVKGGETARYST